ncbi:MAG TPA: tetratricopeptide repeat protein, partial [Rugosimonospora sp.]|nr:tetratricopeptide repeat protein [Rugosimonospora sp.]
PERTPRQLPAPMPGFTGRTGQIAVLDHMLETPVNVAVITGTAGIGKTALSVHWAHQVAHRFPDGQLYLNLRGYDPAGAPMHPGEALRALLRAYQIPARLLPDGQDAQAGLLRSVLAGRRVLMLLDNAHSAEQVRPLLPGMGGCLVLITSRAPMASLITLYGARPVRLDLLTARESWDLLAARLGSDRLSGEPQPVRAIIEHCARLPLALAVVSARATAHQRVALGTLATELREASGLDAFGGDDSACDVRSVFSWSYRRLSPQAATLFRLLAIHCGPDITAPAVAGLAGLPPARCRPLVDELVRVHLVTEHTPGRYTFHDLLRAYATELADREDSRTRRRTALRRALDHYLHTAYAAAVLLYPYRDPITLDPAERGAQPEPLTDGKQARAWFAAEQQVLAALIDRATGQGFDRHAWQLAWTLVDFYLWQGDWPAWAASQRAAVGAAVRLGDGHAQAVAHFGLARPYLRMRRYRDARAHLRQARELFRRLGDTAGEAHTFFVLGSLCERQGRHQQALRHAQRCLALFEAAGHPVGQAIALNNVGWYHTLLGEYEKGLGCCEQALHRMREIGDRHAEANTWDSIGLAHHYLGHHRDAIASFQRAADLFAELGDRDNWALTLARLGDARHAAGEIPTARRTWRQALAVLNELGRPDASALRARLSDSPPPS